VTAVVTEERDLGERDTENDGRDALQPESPIQIMAAQLAA
jgi:hypothetical protein